MERTTCAIVGGGPAGMFLGLMLARAGVQVVVLEKHADFLRDFRGDTVHPTTMRLLDELGLWERFAALPRSEIHKVRLEFGGQSATYVDFDRLRQPHPFIAMVPQWDLLNLLAESASTEPTFTLRMSTEVTGLLHDGDRVIGVRYHGPDGPGELRAALTVACDGRWSVVREQAGLWAREYPVNIDAWWFRLPHRDPMEPVLLPRMSPGRAVVMFPRGDYFQVAYLLPKGRDAALRARGLEAFRRDIAELVPEAAQSAAALASLDDVKFLDVRVNRLRRWHTDGLLCIGDAAHAMSPVGGVGINLAVQDAVAAATLLAGPLLRGRPTAADLAAVRRRRILPTVAVQSAQRLMHLALNPVLRGENFRAPPGFVALFRRLPGLAVIPAYLVGVGLRPERAPAFAHRPGAHAERPPEPPAQ